MWYRGDGLIGPRTSLSPTDQDGKIKRYDKLVRELSARNLQFASHARRNVGKRERKLYGLTTSLTNSLDGSILTRRY